MHVSDCIGGQSFPCGDIEQHKQYIIPYIDINPKEISIIMI